MRNRIKKIFLSQTRKLMSSLRLMVRQLSFQLRATAIWVICYINDPWEGLEPVKEKHII